MKTNKINLLLMAMLIVFLGWDLFNTEKVLNDVRLITARQDTLIAGAKNSDELRLFSGKMILKETEDPESSHNPFLWLDSGAMMYIDNGIAGSIQGSLPKYSAWRLRYSSSNSTDTDDGYHPQNLIRLITRTDYENFTQQAYFYIDSDNYSTSKNKNSSNGLLLFERYKDADNFYYAGIRTDGAAIIKKKYNGEYYTMAYKNIIEGPLYDEDTKTSLLPLKKWVGLKTITKTDAEGRMTISLYIDKNSDGNWKLAISANDNGVQYGSEVIKNGNAGIRIDFMDAKISNYTISKDIQ